MTTTMTSFDARLREMYLAGVDEKKDVRQWLETALIVYSGYKAEKYAPFAAAAEKMKLQEVCSGRWGSLSGDEDAAAVVVANRAKEDIAAAGLDVIDAFGVSLTIGLYSYATALLSYQGDTGAFRRIFATAWNIYAGNER